MIVRFTEWSKKDGSHMELIPETVEETAELARFAGNALRERPDITFSYSGLVPIVSMYTNYVDANRQCNYIRRDKR